MSASLVALSRCGEAPPSPVGWTLDSRRGLLTPGLRVLPISFFLSFFFFLKKIQFLNLNILVVEHGLYFF